MGSSTANYLASDPSDRARVTESPILSINGNSNLPPGHEGPLVGKAEVKWVPQDAAVKYTIRWRKLRGDHSVLAWRMNPTTLPVSFNDEDKREIVGSRQSTATIQPLDREQIYAMQFIYTIQVGRGTSETVFSARDRYVYPATEAVTRSRLATIPLSVPQPNNTYAYVTCDETFPDDKLVKWKTFIDHAFSQWELATDDLVSLEHIERHDGEPACADYSDFVNDIRDMVVMYLRPEVTGEDIRDHTSVFAGQI